MVLGMLAFSLNAVADSNDRYIQDVERRLEPILHVGTSKTKVRDFLHKEELSPNDKSQQDCEKQRNANRKCLGGGYMHVRVPVRKVLNPIESGVHIIFYFDAEDRLVEYGKRVAHTFL